jgi:hypothetical protein
MEIRGSSLRRLKERGGYHNYGSFSEAGAPVE